MMNQSEIELLELINVAHGGNAESFSFDFDWREVMSLAASHGVLGLVVDGVERLPKDIRPGSQLLLQWLGQVLKQEQQYERSWNVACSLASLWASIGVEAAVLKGRSLAQYYPKPEHRYSCDLDVFIAEGWEKACELLRKHGVRLETEIYKEVEFTLEGVYVECHRCITPIRGNKHLQKFEKYLLGLLAKEKSYFEGSQLIQPPLMFNVMLYVEHALGDFLHGKLLLKHIVDWMILRRQSMDWADFNRRCDEFGFSRFVSFLNGLADVIENKVALSSLPSLYQQEFDNIIHMEHKKAGGKSFFQRRVSLFFEIIHNNSRFRNFGYCSMPSFLWNAVVSHFFKKEIH